MTFCEQRRHGFVPFNDGEMGELTNDGEDVRDGRDGGLWGFVVGEAYSWDERKLT